MRISGPAFILTMTLGACGDSTSVSPPASPLSAARSTANYYEVGSQTPPEGVSSEFQSPTSLTVEAAAGWQPHIGAYAEALVRYFATNVQAEATVITKYGSRTSKYENSQIIPLYLEPLVQATIPMSTCEGTIEGLASGKIWSQAIVRTTTIRWGEKLATEQDSYECPRPITGTPRSSEGSSCYNIYIDHYWYYPQTGKVEYRYTEVYQICENAE